MTNLLEQYFSVRNYSETLCQPLQLEDYTPQSAVFASPPKWHLAHTSWFFEEMILKQYVKGYEVFDEAYSFLFNSYYNSIGQRIERSQRGLITRPSVEVVYAYRKHVDDQMAQLITNEVNEEVKELIILGLNHEQQHQELLLTDLKYTLSHNPTYPQYATHSLEEPAQEKGWIKMNEGIYEIGSDGTSFHFDNERGRHRVFLEPYEISKGLVSNGEYLEFINVGGYANAHYWLDEGWAWVQSENKIAPLYWYKKAGDWYYYTLSGLKKVNLDEALCHVSYYEANAFANYSGKRLPTEFEWEAASNQFGWGQRWEWTNSAYLPYPRFKIQDGAVGEYNGKFMINQMVLRGASAATAPNHSRPSYRNFFPANAQWQFSGIRLVK